MAERIHSGARPTGGLYLVSRLGEPRGRDSFVRVADLHAVTVQKGPGRSAETARAAEERVRIVGA